MYKVSVVTPFHNVDMGMFRKCAESMRCQTIGFENIEWIIVVHNCKPNYLPELTEMFKNDQNVIIKELNDGKHTPAMPRNHGMQFVTGPYLGFLDGDDCQYVISFGGYEQCWSVSLRDRPHCSDQGDAARQDLLYDLLKKQGAASVAVLLCFIAFCIVFGNPPLCRSIPARRRPPKVRHHR